MTNAPSSTGIGVTGPAVAGGAAAVREATAVGAGPPERVVVIGGVSAAKRLRMLMSPFAARSTWRFGFEIVMLFAAAFPGYVKSMPSIATFAIFTGPDVPFGSRSSRFSIQLLPCDTAIVSLPSLIATCERLSPLNTPTMRPGIGRYG